MYWIVVCVAALPLLNTPARTEDSPLTRLQGDTLENAEASVASGRAFKGWGRNSCLGRI